ncbi:MAG: twin-arginine translocase TatA/TatE family subunit [Anaerolineales bacterium]|nr:twin-arginine translocase TatA/TatE family subunit [Anaerolineales bacterium]
MDSVFGIGLPEFILIMLIAGIVMGPERIAHTARWLGKTTAQLQAISRGFVRQLTAEIDGADDGAFREALAEMQDLRRQVNELRSELTETIKAPVNDTRKVLGESQELLSRSIQPPTLGHNNGKAPSSQEPAKPPTLPLPKPLNVPDDPEA